MVVETTAAPANAATTADEQVCATYEEHWPRLVRLARLLTGSHHLGEELAQEAFVGLLRHGPVEVPGAYLRRSVVNLSLNLGRRAARERVHLARERDVWFMPPESDNLWPLIVARADQEHPYDVPCVIAFPVIAGNPAYARWVLESTDPA